MGSGSQDLGDQLFLPPSVERCGGHGVSCLAVRGPVHGHPHSRCAWLPLLRRPRDLEAGRPMRLGVLGQGREVPLEVKPLASRYCAPPGLPFPLLLPRPPFYVGPASANLSPPALSSLGATGLSTPRHLPWLGTWPSTLEPLPPTSGPWSQTTCRCPQHGLCPPSGSCVLSCLLSSILLMAPRAFEIWI